MLSPNQAHPRAEIGNPKAILSVQKAPWCCKLTLAAGLLVQLLAMQLLQARLL